LAIDDQKLTCSKWKPTAIEFGKVQIEGNKYYEVDINRKTALYSGLNGKFESNDWNNHVRRTIRRVEIHDEEDAWIRRVSGNDFGLSINWGTRLLTDHGSTAVSWNLDTSYLDTDVTTVIYDKTWIDALNTNNHNHVIALIRNTPAILLFDPKT